MFIFGAKIQTLTISQWFKITQKVSFYNIASINFKKKYIFGFSKIYFAHFLRENSNIANNITVVQNHSKGLILQHYELIFKKKYIFGFSKIYFAHFRRKNSNIGNITVVQNHSRGLILQHSNLQKEKYF